MQSFWIHPFVVPKHSLEIKDGLTLQSLLVACTIITNIKHLVDTFKDDVLSSKRPFRAIVSSDWTLVPDGSFESFVGDVYTCTLIVSNSDGLKLFSYLKNEIGMDDLN